MIINNTYTPCIISSQAISHLTRATIGIHGAADTMAKCFPHAIFFQIPSLYRNLSVADFANTAFAKPCPFPVYADDEGVTARDVWLINRGRSHECMTDRETAAEMKLPLTGNARFSKLFGRTEIYIRNLAMLPGDDDVADMIASVNDGFYIAEGFGFEGSAKGEYAFRIKEGYHIKDGKIGQPIENCVAYGFALDFLRTISKVGDDFKWFTDEEALQHGIQAAIGAPTIKAMLNIASLA